MERTKGETKPWERSLWSPSWKWILHLCSLGQGACSISLFGLKKQVKPYKRCDSHSAPFGWTSCFCLDSFKFMSPQWRAGAAGSNKQKQDSLWTRTGTGADGGATDLHFTMETAKVRRSAFVWKENLTPFRQNHNTPTVSVIRFHSLTWFCWVIKAPTAVLLDLWGRRPVWFGRPGPCHTDY